MKYGIKVEVLFRKMLTLNQCALKTKTKSNENVIRTDFHDSKLPPENYLCMVLTDSILKN